MKKNLEPNFDGAIIGNDGEILSACVNLQAKLWMDPSKIEAISDMLYKLDLNIDSDLLTYSQTYGFNDKKKYHRRWVEKLHTTLVETHEKLQEIKVLVDKLT